VWERETACFCRDFCNGSLTRVQVRTMQKKKIFRRSLTHFFLNQSEKEQFGFFYFSKQSNVAKRKKRDRPSSGLARCPTGSARKSVRRVIATGRPGSRNVLRSGAREVRVPDPGLRELDGADASVRRRGLDIIFFPRERNSRTNWYFPQSCLTVRINTI